MVCYRFGPFELDPSEGTLSRDEKRVKLQDLPFRLLLMLVERPNETITREEVRCGLWPYNTFVEFDNNLAVAIRKVREALCDNAEAPLYVATIPRRGYRFLAPVTRIEPEQLTTANGIGEMLETIRSLAASTKVRQSRASYGMASALLVLAVVGAAAWMHGEHKVSLQPPIKISPEPPTAVPPRRSVAVLGFRNLAGHENDSWLSPVFSEMLNTELGVSSDLRMVSGEDVARAKRELLLVDEDSLGPSTLQRLRTNPGADVVLLGSYVLVGGEGQRRIRLDLRLQDTSSGETMSENAITGEERDLLELTARAGAALRETLGVKTRPGSEATLRATLPANQTATRLYAEGRSKLWAYDMLGARDLLVKAVAGDPKFPLAYSALSEALWHLGSNVGAVQEAKRAVELSSGLPQEDRLLVQGQYKRSLADWPGAVEAYQSLFKMFPDSLDYGLLLASAQAYLTPDAALQTLASLRRLPDPAGSDARIDMAAASAWIGRDYGKARSAARLAIAKGTSQGSYALVGRTYGILCEQGVAIGTNLDQAISDCQQSRDSSVALKDRNGEAMMSTDLAGIYFQKGDITRSEQIFRSAIQEFKRVGNTDGAATAMSNLAATLLATGDLAAAKKLWEDAIPEYQAIQDLDGVALNLNNLGDLARQSGDLEVADTTYHQAKAAAEEIDDKSALAYVLNGLGDLLKNRGALAASRKSYEASLSLRKQIGENATAGESETSLAALSIEEGHAADAEATLRKWSDRFKKEQQSDDELAARTYLIEALLAQGKDGEAQKETDSAQKLAKNSQNLYVQLQFNTSVARVLLRSKNPRGAMPIIDETLSRARKHGYLGIRFSAMLVLADAERQTGNEAASKKLLSDLEREARDKGFGLIARKIASIS